MFERKPVNTPQHPHYHQPDQPESQPLNQDKYISLTLLRMFEVISIDIQAHSQSNCQVEQIIHILLIELR